MQVTVELIEHANGMLHTAVRTMAERDRDAMTSDALAEAVGELHGVVEHVSTLCSAVAVCATTRRGERSDRDDRQRLVIAADALTIAATKIGHARSDLDLANRNLGSAG